MSDSYNANRWCISNLMDSGVSKYRALRPKQDRVEYSDVITCSQLVVTRRDIMIYALDKLRALCRSCMQKFRA